ncbi:MAG: hypothetical protein ACD_72C00214G0001 [uncultured bacterium]|nr:MAG: hypothetical protein ACD_72C00214G0001 [uncultured bacterium]
MPDFSYKFYRTTTDALQAMHEAILGARQSIYWEIYALIDDSVGGPFVDILCEKARSGVEVKIIVDAIGSFDLSRLAISRLRGAGVDVVYYNTLSPRLALFHWARSLGHRNHRKVLVIDREIVFIGGVNVGKIYTTWHDLHLRIVGKVTAPLLRSFARAYIHCGGDRKKVRHLLHSRLSTEWEEIKSRFKFILQSPVNLNYSRSRKIFLDALSKSEKKFNLLTPYFVPDKKFFYLADEAKERGVVIDLFLPFRPDHKFIDWVGGFYSKIAHKHGVNVYLSHIMNHGKAMTADQSVGFVGSANFTPRSFFNNEEAGVLFTDSLMVEELNLIFDDWRNTSLTLDGSNYLHFGLSGKIKDWLGKFLGGLI